MKSSLGSSSTGSPNSVLPAYCDEALATATRVGSEYVAVVLSAAVARSVAVPAARACMTPLASMLAMSGVSLCHVNVVVTTAPLGSCSVANSWSSNPTGNDGSLGRRPLNVIVLDGGGGGLLLQKRNVLAAGPLHAPVGSRASDCPTGDELSATPISIDVMPSAGPPAAVNAPS